MAPVALDLIDEVARLRVFAPEWLRFLHAVPPTTPFQTPHWLLTWWTHFGSGTLHTLVFRHDDAIAGVLPCFLHEWNERRQLTLVGAGVSDFLDPIFDPCHVPGILTALRAHLRSRADWDVCDWQDLSADTPLSALAPAEDDTPCSRVALCGSFEAFMAERSQGMRRNLRRYRQKAESLGALRFAVTADADPALMDALIDLHRERWVRSGKPGMIDANRAAPFIRDVAAVLARENMLLFFTLYLRDRVAAILLALRNSTTIFSYLSAFDPERETLGPGRELLARAFEYAHREGYQWWNFLRGAEAYKFSWGAQALPKCRLVLRRAQTYTRPMP